MAWGGREEEQGGWRSGAQKVAASGENKDNWRPLQNDIEMFMKNTIIPVICHRLLAAHEVTQARVETVFYIGQFHNFWFSLLYYSRTSYMWCL